MTPSRDAVLLVTHSADHFTVDRVEAALRVRSARPVRLLTDRFPTEVTMSTRLTQQAVRHELDQSLHSEELKAVWLRHIASAHFGEDLDPEYHADCQRETQAALKGFLNSLVGPRWMDPLARIEAASDKLVQLRQAAAHGLSIPATLVTNDPAAVRELFRELGGRMVTKLLMPLSISMGRPDRFVYTSAVTERDLGELEALRQCPMVFQERVEKGRDLRVIFVAGKLFVGAVDAARSRDGQLDWRQAHPGECLWQEDELPEPARQCLSALMDTLGLSFGAVDFVRTPDGECVFLEVNPTGEWGMLERDLGYPISDAIAEALLR